MEYSNLGYALLGRIITNVSGRPYAETISSSLLKPLGMNVSGFVVDAAPPERRALGYRWEDDAWRLEPTMAHGAFGAMGGLQTSANDYAKWVTYLLSAWPPRDDADAGPVKRATVRELVARLELSAVAAAFRAHRRGCVPAGGDLRHGHVGGRRLRARPHAQPQRWLPGLWVAPVADARSSRRGVRTREPHLRGTFHRGVGCGGGVEQGRLLRGAEIAGQRRPCEGVQRGRRYLPRRKCRRGRRCAGHELPLDRDADKWRRELAELRKKVGNCDTSAPVKATGSLAGEFTWRCAHGRVSGSVLLAPTRPARIQGIKLDVKAP